MYSIGYDIGSSSVKAALIFRDSGKTLTIVSYPETEMEMSAPQEGWAEQDPESWWQAVCKATQNLLVKTGVNPNQITSIGVAYQMHGLVLIDENRAVLRPSIIWCDSRAVEVGERGLYQLGADYCYGNLLNSPGNFTASKLKWVKENEPEIYQKTDKVLLPGDYIAMKFTGDVSTTISGLSEGIFWDFKQHTVSDRLLEAYQFDGGTIPPIVDNFEIQGVVHKQAAVETGLAVGTPITYRAGDQPNNALALNVFHPGEIAATGGTSGVVYGISDQLIGDKNSRVNSFAHVNHRSDRIRVGQLLCINGAGSQYAWIRKNIASQGERYQDMEEKLKKIPIGSEGLSMLPFGNGAERMLNNAQIGAQVNNIQFHLHTQNHLYRAALEGVAFAFVYGIKAMGEVGINPQKIKVGNDNLFQSAIFSNTVSTLLGSSIEMMDTTGAVGAAKASRVGLGDYSAPEEAIETIDRILTYNPTNNLQEYQRAYQKWANYLSNVLKEL